MAPPTRARGGGGSGPPAPMPACPRLAGLVTRAATRSTIKGIIGWEHMAWAFPQSKWKRHAYTHPFTPPATNRPGSSFPCLNYPAGQGQGPVDLPQRASQAAQETKGVAAKDPAPAASAAYGRKPASLSRPRRCPGDHTRGVPVASDSCTRSLAAPHQPAARGLRVRPARPGLVPLARRQDRGCSESGRSALRTRLRPRQPRCSLRAGRRPVLRRQAAAIRSRAVLQVSTSSATKAQDRHGQAQQGPRVQMGPVREPPRQQADRRYCGCLRWAFFTSRSCSASGTAPRRLGRSTACCMPGPSHSTATWLYPLQGSARRYPGHRRGPPAYQPAVQPLSAYGTRQPTRAGTFQVQGLRLRGPRGPERCAQSRCRRDTFLRRARRGTGRKQGKGRSSDRPR